jgi:hypothetical protein
MHYTFRYSKTGVPVKSLTLIPRISSYPRWFSAGTPVSVPVQP